MVAILGLLALAGAAASATYGAALAVLELPGKLPSPLGEITFIFFILTIWETIYQIFGFLLIDLNLFGIPLNGYSVAMVVVTGWVVSHFVFSN